jgi:hypothetical protein
VTRKCGIHKDAQGNAVTVECHVLSEADYVILASYTKAGGRREVIVPVETARMLCSLMVEAGLNQ